MKRLLTTVGVVVTLALMGLAIPAYANSNANGSISVSPSSVSAGSAVRISGAVHNKVCPRGDMVTITSDSTLMPPDGFGPQVHRQADGSFATTYTVPTSTPSGTHQVGLRCGGGNVGVSAPLTVTAVPFGAPQTGAGGTAHGTAPAWAFLGIGCLTLAGAALGLRRKLVRRSV